MDELARLLLLLALAGVAVTLLGSAAIWYMDEARRVRRALRNVLKAPPEAVVVARGRGKGAGFSFSSGLAAVAWDSGAWCLVYRIYELVGLEIIVDGEVVARAFRGEPRKALDHLPSEAARVTLRLVFDDPNHPDFALDLWLAGDELRRKPSTAAEAIQEANRWLARAEAILRRPNAPRAPEPVVAAQPQPQPQPQPAAPPWEPEPHAFDDDEPALDADDEEPFDDDPERR
ncbi:hypothetical protein [Phenylobacterium sp.]|uniref:hypothetical protein n=1 Tax=Phenylobacterium sp. TaxID=1871053 RepID=UPI00273299E5|nr:hypothetical protein [Phenylobacterium sp.]MDP3852268.1 hypothetical protein [Phenylobacterium sp.]